MYLIVFTRMPVESYRRRLMSLLLCLCDIFPALISSLVRERKDAKTAKVNWVKSSTRSGSGVAKDCQKK